jgi:hypothetical protein
MQSLVGKLSGYYRNKSTDKGNEAKVELFSK